MPREPRRLLECARDCRLWTPLDLLRRSGTCPYHPERAVLAIEPACEHIDEYTLPEKVARESKQAVPV